jgi:hypothetical protein
MKIIKLSEDFSDSHEKQKKYDIHENDLDSDDLNSIPEEHRDGNCFKSAAEMVFNDPSLTLVHGYVTGQGPIQGIRLSHAWAEKNISIPSNFNSEELSQLQNMNLTMVYDNSNGNNIEIPVQIYYSIGNVNPNELKKYTSEEARKKLLEYKTWGPWEL